MSTKPAAGQHETLVAEGTDGPVGFATFEKAYLHQLVVAPGAKGSGTAVRLLDAVKVLSPAGLALDVNQVNVRGVRFYVRERFTIEGARVNPGSGLATWRMHWAGS